MSNLSRVTELLGEGAAFMEFAIERDWPLLFHVTVHPEEEFSQVSDTYKVIERHPELRYCLAHSISFHRGYLELAGQMPNVWFETSGINILTQLTYEDSAIMPLPRDRFDCDYSDHIKVMQALAECYTETILWGADAPYHSYIHRRMQGEGKYYEFRLKGTYEQEKAALDVLPASVRAQISKNSVEYLFG